MKNKIVLLIYNLKRGGAERQVSYYSYLLKDYYDVEVVIFDKIDEKFYKTAVPIISLHQKSYKKSLFGKIRRITKQANLLNKYVDENQVDMVISFSNDCNLINTLSRHKAKKVCSIRGYADYNKNIFAKIVLKHKKNIILVQTERLKREIFENYRLVNEVKVLPNYFDIDEIQNKLSEPLTEIENNIIKDNFTICMLGSFKEVKNHSGMIKIFNRVRSKLDGLKLLMIGDDNGHKNEVIKLVDNSEFKSDIIIMDSLINPYNILSKCDLLVLPSFSEGVPNVIGEALICGTPVIAADCMTGPRELLSENHLVETNTIDYSDYGILVKPFKNNQDELSIDYFTEAIYKIITDNKLYLKYKENTKIGASKFNRHSYLDRMISIIDSIL